MLRGGRGSGSRRRLGHRWTETGGEVSVQTQEWDLSIAVSSQSKNILPPLSLRRGIGAGSCCAGYVDGANARLRPHPLDKGHFVDELMLQSAQNMQADEHDKRRGQ